MTSTHTDVVAARLVRCRFRFGNEDMLQRGILEALEQAGIRAEREVRLDGRCRIDLLAADTVGIEVKVAGHPTDVRRQVERYLAFDRIGGLVLVTTRPRHADVAPSAGKPFRIVQLAGGAL